MKYQIFHKYQDSNWIATTLYFDDLRLAVRRAQECATDAIAYGMTLVQDKMTGLHVVEFPGGGGYPRYIAEGYTALVTAALQHKTEVKKVSPKGKSCPDCKDGFYYPLIGAREPCPTCKTDNDSKLIMHLQDVWEDHPWGLTKISKPTTTGLPYAVDAHVHIPFGTTPEIINDKLVDTIDEDMRQANVTEFYEFGPPVFNIIKLNDGMEIDAFLEIGL